MRIGAVPRVAVAASLLAACGQVNDTFPASSVDKGGRDAGESAGRSSGGTPSSGGVSSAGGFSTGGSQSTGGVSNGGSQDAGGTAESDGAPGVWAVDVGTSIPGAPWCSSSTDLCPEETPPLGIPVNPPCCTGAGQCGFYMSSSDALDVAAGCQPLFQPGLRSPDCPDTSTWRRCCRFDGTCGTDLSLSGVGCAEPSASDAGQRCQITAACGFIFQATTVAANGRYAPQNVGAIWIEDGSGRFVKTLDAWSYLRLSAAVAWWRSSAGNDADAVTGATRRYHGPIQASWGCTDASGRVVPNGPYRVCMTFAEDASAALPDAGPPAAYLCVPFEWSGKPLDLRPPGDAHFQNLHIWLR